MVNLRNSKAVLIAAGLVWASTAPLLVGCNLTGAGAPTRVLSVEGQVGEMDWLRLDASGNGSILAGANGGLSDDSVVPRVITVRVPDSIRGVPMMHAVHVVASDPPADLYDASGWSIVVRRDGNRLVAQSFAEATGLPSSARYGSLPEPDALTSVPQTLAVVPSTFEPSEGAISPDVWMRLDSSGSGHIRGISTGEGGIVGRQADAWAFTMYVPDSTRGVECVHELRLLASANTRLSVGGADSGLLFGSLQIDSVATIRQHGKALGNRQSVARFHREGSFLICDSLEIGAPAPSEFNPAEW